VILYANGCSMTYGSELADDPVTRRCRDDAHRWWSAWPGWLGRGLRAQRVVNQAVPSGSNDRVVRTALEWCASALASGIPPEELFVVIGWSSPLRREFYVAGAYRQLVPHHGYALPELDLLATAYREVAWSELDSMARFVGQVVLLQSFLKLHAIPHLFFDAISSVHEDLAHADPGTQAAADLIDRELYVGFGSPGGSLADRLNGDLPKWNGQHPSAEGHRAWAAHLLDVVAERGIVPLPFPDAPSRPEPRYEGTERILMLDRKIGVAARPDSSSRRSAGAVRRRGWWLAARMTAARERDPFLYP
jgi:Family of unknown function (DUF6071)